MKILPKKYSQFKDKNYWNNFFQQLKNTKQQFFQWYGNYEDFKLQLSKIFKHIQYKYEHNLIECKKQDPIKIFHIGCGKSTFGQDILLDYPQYKIVNTDYSEQIIKDMIKRTLSLKLFQCKYQVFDMFEQLNEKYVGKFHIVLDKGTLDAILPEDKQHDIQKVKNVFFSNVVKALNKQQTTCYVIVSMLQPFLLRTILDYFYNTNFQIQIQQSKIKDSKMQPFLVYIKRFSDKQKKQSSSNKIIIKLINGKQVSSSSKDDIMTKIQQLQQTIASNQKLKKLVPNQHLTYNISNSDNNDKIRYTIQIIDNQYQTFIKNTCAIFIVPQGKQNSYLFSTRKGLIRFIRQVGTSRLIIVKLVIGNNFKNIQQVKSQINTFIYNFIQSNCNIKQVPFMTDAEQLGVRKYVYQNQKFFIEEILANTQQQAYRRLILKTNLQLVQTQYKISYNPAQNVSKNIKQLQKKTKILNSKKGKVVSIDKNYLDQGYSQFIITGLNRFGCFKQNQNKTKKQILVLGGGGYAIPKFIYEHYNTNNQLSITTVEIQPTLCDQQVLSIFQVQQYVKNDNFNLINADAYEFIMNSSSKCKYSSIIIDINDNNSQIQLSIMPPDSFLEQQFMIKLFQLLQNNGVLVFNVIREGFLKNYLFNKLYPMNKRNKLFSIAYIAKQECLQQQQKIEKNKMQSNQEDDSFVIFLIKTYKEIKQQDIYLSRKNKNYRHISQFQMNSIKNIKIINPQMLK